MLVHTFNSKTSVSEAAESVSLSQFILERHKRSPHHPRLHNESQSQTNKQKMYLWLIQIIKCKNPTQI